LQKTVARCGRRPAGIREPRNAQHIHIAAIFQQHLPVYHGPTWNAFPPESKAARMTVRDPGCHLILGLRWQLEPCSAHMEI